MVYAGIQVKVRDSREGVLQVAGFGLFANLPIPNAQSRFLPGADARAVEVFLHLRVVETFDLGRRHVHPPPCGGRPATAARSADAVQRGAEVVGDPGTLVRPSACRSV